MLGGSVPGLADEDNQGFQGSPFFMDPQQGGMQSMLPAGSSGGSGVLQPSYSLSLQEQQALASGQLPSLGGQQLAYVEIGSAGGLPIIQPQFAAVAMQPAVSQPSSQPSSGQQQSQQRGPAASRASKPRPKRPYKPPHQVAQERKLKDEANDYIRRLEQQLGKARSDLERLQRDNTTLQRKAVVLSKHSSFRRCAASMVQELQESMTLGAQLQSMDCSQHVLDAAEKGLPEPQVLEYLRKMSSSEAVQHYNSVVARVRSLLHQAEQGSDPATAQQQLEDIFAMKEKGGEAQQ